MLNLVSTSRSIPPRLIASGAMTCIDDVLFSSTMLRGRLSLILLKIHREDFQEDWEVIQLAKL